MQLKLLATIVGIVVGIFLIWGGEWLIWDWINSIVNNYVNWDLFCREWEFYAPLFLYKWDCKTWTGPYDLGKMWIDLGTFILIISAFFLGFLMKEPLEKAITKLKSLLA